MSRAAPGRAPPVREALSTLPEVLEVLRTRQLLTLSARGELPSLVGLVARTPVVGSWWGHPDGARIFALATALEGSPEVLVARLADGKVTFVHRALWPALYRVVTDPGWRASASAALDADARRLLGEVELVGELELGKASRARGALEASLLVHAEQVHTDRGHHATRLSTWQRWAPAEVVAAAGALTLDGARGELEAALAGTRSVVAPGERAVSPRRRR